MKKQITAAMMILAIIAAPATAGSVDNQAFESKVFHTKADMPMQLEELSQKEMKETEGAVAPLVAVGLMVGGRFIAQRFVTQTVARNIVRSAATNATRTGNGQIWGVMANTRSQARAIAGNSRIREFHPGSGNRYTHYHTDPRNGSHVWYGKAR